MVETGANPLVFGAPWPGQSSGSATDRRLVKIRGGYVSRDGAEVCTVPGFRCMVDLTNDKTGYYRPHIDAMRHIITRAMTSGATSLRVGAGVSRVPPATADLAGYIDQPSSTSLSTFGVNHTDMAVNAHKGKFFTIISADVDSNLEPIAAERLKVGSRHKIASNTETTITLEGNLSTTGSSSPDFTNQRFVVTGDSTVWESQYYREWARKDDSLWDVPKPSELSFPLTDPLFSSPTQARTNRGDLQIVRSKVEHLHGARFVRGKLVIFGESGFRREPIIDVDSGEEVTVVKWTQGSSGEAVVELSGDYNTQVSRWCAPDQGVTVFIEGMSDDNGFDLAKLEGRFHQIKSLGTSPPTLTLNTTIAAASTSTTGVGGNVYVVRETWNGDIGSGGLDYHGQSAEDSIDDPPALTAWYIDDLSVNPHEAGLIETCHPSYVFNRQRDHSSGTTDGSPGQVHEGDPKHPFATTNKDRGFSRRRQKSLPFRLNPDVTNGRILLAAPGYGCCFQIPVDTSPSGSDKKISTYSHYNTERDKPRALGVPKGVCVDRLDPLQVIDGSWDGDEFSFQPTDITALDGTRSYVDTILSWDDGFIRISGVRDQTAGSENNGIQLQGVGGVQGSNPSPPTAVSARINQDRDFWIRALKVQMQADVDYTVGETEPRPPEDLWEAGNYRFAVNYKDEVTGEQGLLSEEVLVTIPDDPVFMYGAAEDDDDEFRGWLPVVWCLHPGYVQPESGALSVQVWMAKSSTGPLRHIRTVGTQTIKAQRVSNTGAILPTPQSPTDNRLRENQFDVGHYGLPPGERVLLGNFQSVGDIALPTTMRIEMEGTYCRRFNELAKRTVPPDLAQQPRGAKSLRTIRDVTVFAGTQGDSGSELELAEMTATFAYQPSDLSGGSFDTVFTPKFDRHCVTEELLMTVAKRHGDADSNVNERIRWFQTTSEKGPDLDHVDLIAQGMIPASYTGLQLYSEELWPYPQRTVEIVGQVNIKAPSTTFITLASNGVTFDDLTHSNPATFPRGQYELGDWEAAGTLDPPGTTAGPGSWGWRSVAGSSNDGQIPSGTPTPSGCFGAASVTAGGFSASPYASGPLCHNFGYGSDADFTFRYLLRTNPVSGDFTRVVPHGRAGLMMPRGRVQLSELDRAGEVPATNVQVVSPTKDDDPEAVAEFRGTALIMTRQQTYSLIWNQGPLGAAPFLVSSQTGCSSPRATGEHDDGAFWISDRGVELYTPFGSVEFMGRDLAEDFSGQFPRYKRDSRGLMRHAFGFHDESRGLVWFGLFADLNKGTKNEVRVTYKGVTYNWETKVGDTSVPTPDEARSRFPCDEVLLWSFRANAFSTWNPPPGLEILDMFSVRYGDGEDRVSFLSTDGRVYAFDDNFAEGNSETLILATSDRGSSTATLMVTGSWGTDSASRSAGNFVGVGMTVLVTDSQFNAKHRAKVESSDPVNGTITLDAAGSWDKGDRVEIGVKSMTIETPWLQPKPGEPSTVSGVSVKARLQSSLTSKSAGGVRQRAWGSVSGRAVDHPGGQFQENKASESRIKELVEMSSGPAGIDFIGPAENVPVAHTLRFSRGTLTGSDVQVLVEVLGGAKACIADLFFEAG